MRKFTLLFAGVALSVATLTACIGGPPPPPPTDPHDVLVVGDSLASSFGCVLGDGAGCPPRPGYTTSSQPLGACTITRGTLLLYNRWTTSQANCWDWDTLWSSQADFYRPKVVVIHTGGWEIVDRWTPGAFPPGCPPDDAFFCAPPDAQWGDPSQPPELQVAVSRYAAELYAAIKLFAEKPWQPKVLLSNSIHSDLLGPVPELPGNPLAHHSYYEAYPPSAPGNWDAPNSQVGYRSARTKKQQLNIVMQLVKDFIAQNDPGVDDRVVLFDLKKHFNLPTDVYTDYVCPPPDDATIVPENVANFRTPDPSDTAWQCDNGAPNSQGNPWPLALLARDPDRVHLSPAGSFEILQPYLESCVKALIPVAGGDLSKCS